MVNLYYSDSDDPLGELGMPQHSRTTVVGSSSVASPSGALSLRLVLDESSESDASLIANDGWYGV